MNTKLITIAKNKNTEEESNDSSSFYLYFRNVLINFQPERGRLYE